MGVFQSCEKSGTGKHKHVSFSSIGLEVKKVASHRGREAQASLAHPKCGASPSLSALVSPPGKLRACKIGCGQEAGPFWGSSPPSRPLWVPGSLAPAAVGPRAQLGTEHHVCVWGGYKSMVWGLTGPLGDSAGPPTSTRWMYPGAQT